MTTPKKELTQAHLKELLHYDPETGHFTWLVTRRGTAVAGSRAGSDGGRGYIRIEIEGIKHRAHRLAFLYMTGTLPPKHVDHINRDKPDNRWSNLRPATNQENAGNVAPRRNNTSGHLGVSWHKRDGKWRAQGARDGRRIHLGYFDNLEEATAVAQAWREETYGVFATAA